MVQQYVSSHSYIHQSTVDYHTIKNRNLSKSEDLLIETDTESTLLSSTPSLFQIRKPREQHYNTLSNTRNNTLNTRKSTFCLKVTEYIRLENAFLDLLGTYPIPFSPQYTGRNRVKTYDENNHQ